MTQQCIAMNATSFQSLNNAKSFKHLRINKEPRIVPNPVYPIFFPMLAGGWCVQHGYSGQKDDSCLRRDRGGQHEFSLFRSATQNGIEFKT